MEGNIYSPGEGEQKIVYNDRIVLIQEEPRGPSQLIETNAVAANNGTSKLTMPYVDNLSNTQEQTIVIKALRIIPAAVLTNAPTSGAATAPLAELAKMTLTLYCEGWEKGQQIPVLTLIDTFTEGSGIPWRNRTAQFANWKNVDWNKSFFQTSNGTVIAGAPYTIIAEVEYVRFRRDKQGNEIEIVGP